jgi:protein phosphatase
VVDDVPVVAGAFVDPAAAEAPGEDSPAERAAAIARPARADAADPEQPAARRRWRGPVIILAVVALLAAALGGTYAWAQTQYYVGVSSDQVVVYRGVNAAVGPLKFSRVAERTSLKVGDLNQSVQSQVRSGIPANSRGDADRIVRRLNDQRKPVCRPAAATSSSASPTPSSAGPGGTSSSRSSTTASRTTAKSGSAAASGAPAGTRTASRSTAAASATAAARSRAGAATGASSGRTAPATTPAVTTPPAGSASTGPTVGSGDCRRTS